MSACFFPSVSLSLIYYFFNPLHKSGAMIYHPHLLPFLKFLIISIFHQIYERSAASSMAATTKKKRTKTNSLLFLSSCSSHVHSAPSARQQVFSQLIFSSHRAGSYLFLFILTVLNWPHLSFFKWSIQKYVVSPPRSPVPSVVSTHSALSFRWGESMLFIHYLQNKYKKLENRQNFQLKFKKGYF